MARSRAGRRPLWLIAGRNHGSMNVLTVNTGGGKEILPLFSYEDEAEAFLYLGGAPEADWRAREVPLEELVSVLYGACARVERVALDPLPMVEGNVEVDLATMGRERFVRHLMSGDSDDENTREAADIASSD